MTQDQLTLVRVQMTKEITATVPKWFATQRNLKIYKPKIV